MPFATRYPSKYCSRSGQKVRRLYQTWADMHRRCRPGERQEQVAYYERGIRVCEAWHDWPTFAQWAMSNGYQDDLTIDRIDNDRGYKPDNCRFIPFAENASRRDPVRASEAGRRAQLKANRRSFRCVETGEVFFNQEDAVRAKGLSAGGISMALKGKLKTTGGLRWAYIETTNMEGTQENAA